MQTVSIIVPNYNHDRFLKQRLDSIFNQTYQDFEVILLDDCSSDNSIEILLEYAKNPKVSHLIVNKKNSGNSFLQWNKGIMLAKGEYVWIAESDDYSDITFLEKAVNTLQLNPNLGLVFCQSWKVNELNIIIDTWLNHTNDLDIELFKNDFTCKGVDFIESFLIHKNVIPNASAVVFKKIISDKVNGPNYKIKYCGDWFFWLKISTVTEIAFIAESLNYFRCHKNSVIFKASHYFKKKKIYPGKFDNTMRRKFSKWLLKQKGSSSKVLSENKMYISKEYVKKLYWHVENNQLFKATCAGLNYYFITKDHHFFLNALNKKYRQLFKRIFCR